MALSDAQRDQAVRTALSHIGSSRGRVTDSELYLAIYNRLGLSAVDLSTNVSITAAVQSARRISSYGAALHSGSPLPYQRPPVDPTLYEGPWRYGYRVAMSWIDPATGESYDTVLTIRSDVELSRTQIMLEAGDVAANTRMEEISPGRGKPDVSVDRITRMTIITGGRMR